MEQSMELNMKADELYREEIYSDLRLGTIRMLIPVNEDGSEDRTRSRRFVGQAQVMTPAGPMPISFDLEAGSLSEAVHGFGKAAEQALQETARELEEYRRKAASGIVVPGAEDVSRLAGGDLGGGLIKP